LAQNRIDQVRIQEATDKLQSESAARQSQLEVREAKVAEQLAALQQLQGQQDTSLDEARSQVDAETEQLRAACELLENERRQFLEEKGRWKQDQSAAPGAFEAPASSTAEEASFPAEEPSSAAEEALPPEELPEESKPRDKEHSLQTAAAVSEEAPATAAAP